MTRRELAAAIHALPEGEKLELLGEVWDSLSESRPMPEWHKEELDRRATSDPSAFESWEVVRARLASSK